MALAFTMREVDGLSFDEVCDALNISRSNLSVCFTARG
jgi:DNA-directed RNA polymerase specialized sigma24 family protein